MPSSERSEATELRGLVLALATAIVGVAFAVILSHGPPAPRGGEAAALDGARRLRAKGDAAGALHDLTECAACACTDEAAEIEVDLGRYDDALSRLKRTAYCAEVRHRGTLAEATVGTGNPDEGLRLALEALAQSADEPHANFAKAWALSRSGFSGEALSAAEIAVRGGRGLPALLLLATLRAAAGDPRGAREAVDEAARLVPDNPRAQYDLGVVAQSEGHYREAREAYLHALALDPKLADARYNLVVLTHKAGADDEARHHLAALAAVAPDDPRVPKLRAALLMP